jgi:hypothetical protein
MTLVLTQAAKALREVGADGFEIEVSVEVSQGSVPAGEKERPRETGGPGGAEGPREIGQLAVRRGAKRWHFRALEIGQLTKERATQVLSSADFGGAQDLKSQGEKGDAREEGGSAAPLLVSERVTEGAADLLRAEGTCYLDTAGNCYLRGGSLLVFVRGRKPRKEPASRRPNRAFEGAGLKLIFALLAREEAAGWTYRRLSDLVGISRGAVGYVMEDLRRLGFLEEVGGKRRLRRRPELLKRWAEPFAERLRPTLLRGRFSPAQEKGSAEWRELALDPAETQWGGEPAVELLVGDLRPKRFSLYTRQATSKVCRELGLAPDEEGAVELLEMFWDPEVLGQFRGEGAPGEEGKLSRSVPPALAYGDLIARADSRAVEAARRVREEHLNWESPRK